MKVLVLVGLLGVPLAACDNAATPAATDDDPLSFDIGPEDPEAGKAMFEPSVPAGAKEDSVLGRKGIATSFDNGDAQVWPIRNQWADTNTAEAKLPGMAWPANSGLSWDQKYAAWVQSLPRSTSIYGGETFSVTTPYGKTLPGPTLECAEVAMFLRASFASWYGLPFYMEGSDGGKRIYLGHFGFLYEDGTRFRSTPAFKTAYRDHSALAGTWQTAGWPQDTTLRGRRLGGSQDDFQPALFEGARAGAYFDEMFLNKRVGYFMLLLLGYFGSINLADASNTFNLDPTAIRAGDPLVQRWQRNGIGHVYVVKKAETMGDGRISAEIVSGSMPRRQPVWENAASSQSAFTSDYAGGPGTNSDGKVYATLGGGLKRWRTAVDQGGRWTNTVPVADRGVFIDASNTTAVGARIETFRRILGSLSPSEQRDTLIAQIEAQRAHLRRYPASCSARTRREAAFAKLYSVMEAEFGKSRADVDKEFRKLEDYVLSELVYSESKTCCWNSSTSAMYEIAIDKAMADAGDGKVCVEPPVFKATAGGYQLFQAHATLIGRAAEWRAWTADESCPQANVTDDRMARSQATPYCTIREMIDDEGPAVVPGHDAFEPNDAATSAAAIQAGSVIDAAIGEGDVDFFVIEVPSGGRLEIDLLFRHAEGDLDLQAAGTDGASLGQSGGSTDSEQLQLNVTAGKVVLKVYPYGTAGSRQTYQLKTTFVAQTATVGPDRFEANDTLTAAKAVTPGAPLDLSSCGDADFFVFDVARRGDVAVAIDFQTVEGDLDLRLYNANGVIVGASDGTGNNETIKVMLEPGRYRVEVHRYAGSAGGTRTCQAYRMAISL
jgi:hypothetical protein